MATVSGAVRASAAGDGSSNEAIDAKLINGFGSLNGLREAARFENDAFSESLILRFHFDRAFPEKARRGRPRKLRSKN